MSVTLLFFMVNEKSQIESLRVLEITGKLVKSAVPKVFLFYPVGKCGERWQEGHTGLRGAALRAPLSEARGPSEGAFSSFGPHE